MTKYRYIYERDTTAAYGLAADEYVMESHGKPLPWKASLRLYNYADYAVLAGRFQDIHAEIDIEACKTLGYDFGRRLTGGGAIIMGSGQLGICFATASSTFKWDHVRTLYRLFSQPVIEALAGMGVEARFRSKNDLEVNGKKIAGLGVYVNPKGNIQFHTSLLVDLDVNDMLRVLKIPIQKYADKRKIASVAQRITTISRETGRKTGLEETAMAVKNAFARFFGIAFDNRPFTPEELMAIRLLENNRYRNDEWIFQHSRQSDMDGMSLKKTPAGLLRTYIGLKGETIKSILITGDFFEQSDVFNRIETELKWSALDREKIEQTVSRILRSEKFRNKVTGLAPAVVTEAIWLAAQRALAARRYTYKGSCYYPKKEEPVKSEH